MSKFTFFWLFSLLCIYKLYEDCFIRMRFCDVKLKVMYWLGVVEGVTTK